MQRSLARLATSVSSRPLSLQETSASLLPPIPLYRRLLRAHRLLPLEMRSLGDDYVKAGGFRHPTHPARVSDVVLAFEEFRRHQKIDNPVHIIGFLSQWKVYLDELNVSAGPDFKGKQLDPTVFERMSAEQIGQLYELMHASRDIWKSPEELGSEHPMDETMPASDKN
ncbi:acetate non-utilizing protein 9 [Tulasnella sp. 330]|nr:acetate non-utilizing protein 9 [Tulasnella sp. 330]KAG8885267.1 acetate non-utilizing protein 9 [Tulasnella sp. 331]